MGDARQVGRLAHHRRVVELEVACVHDETDRRADGQPHRVGNAVGHTERLHLEAPEAYPLPGHDGPQVRLRQQAVLLEFNGDEVAG